MWFWFEFEQRKLNIIDLSLNCHWESKISSLNQCCVSDAFFSSFFFYSLHQTMLCSNACFLLMYSECYWYWKLYFVFLVSTHFLWGSGLAVAVFVVCICTFCYNIARYNIASTVYIWRDQCLDLFNIQPILAVVNR